jgi:hypothetical protein
VNPCQEALDLKESAVADALRATKREDYMLDLMTEASQDMACVLSCIFPLLRHYSCGFSYLVFLGWI